MGKIVDITEASVRADGPDYNKFDFQKGNNFARILLPNIRIAEGYVHSVYRSEAMMVQDDKGRIKPDWEQTSYAGTYHCTGDFNTVAKNPTYGDPDKCPICASLHSGPRIASNPRKQFALNVFRYQTKPNSFEVVGDGITVELWKHGNDRNVNPITSYLKESEQKPTSVDFLIETDGSMFKKLQIQGMFPAAYSKEGKGALKASVQAAMTNLYDDDTLLSALGEQASAEELANTVRAAATQALAGKDSPGTSDSGNGMFVAEPVTAVATQPVQQLDTQVEKTSADDLAKVDVASIADLL